MDFQFSPAQQELRNLCRRFTDTELKPNAAIWDEEERFPAPMVKKAAEGRRAVSSLRADRIRPA